ncbi:MAG: hypothetical protein V1708_04075, partial [Candidatus Micrarchaeota archaeon]
MARRGQTSLEYLMIVVAFIIVIVVVFMLIRGNLVVNATGNAANKANQSLYNSKSYLFFDNFDTGSSARWQTKSGVWQVAAQEYLQTLTTQDVFKLSIAGDAGWYNYASEAMMMKTESAQGGGQFIGGVSARVNPDTLARYSCYLSSDGAIQLLKFSSLSDYAPPLAAGTVTYSEGMHSLAITVTGDSIACFYDGLAAASATDAELVTGMTGIDAYAATSVDEIRVWKIDGPVPTFSEIPTAIPTPTPLPSPSPSPTPTPTAGPCISEGGSCKAGSCADYYDCAPQAGLCAASEDEFSCCTGACVAPPAVSSVQYSDVTWDAECKVNATITWDTDVASDSMIEVGFDADFTFNSTVNYTLTTSHSLTATLQENTDIFLKAWSCLPAPNGAACGNSSGQMIHSTDIAECDYGGGSPLIVAIMKPLYH